VKLELAAGGESRAYTVTRRDDGLDITSAGGEVETVRVLSGGEGWLVLEWRGRRIPFAGIVTTAGRQLWVAGETFRYDRVLAGVAARDADDRSLTSPIPAVVLEVLVAPGEAVEEGQKLILLESMKMVLPISATRAGIVRAILCQVGQAVPPGVPLIEIEESAGSRD
jgi:3-methylcrotonyl-CoA carboxylase alpha subunit